MGAEECLQFPHTSSSAFSVGDLEFVLGVQRLWFFRFQFGMLEEEFNELLLLLENILHIRHCVLQSYGITVVGTVRLRLAVIFFGLLLIVLINIVSIAAFFFIVVNFVLQEHTWGGEFDRNADSAR